MLCIHKFIYIYVCIDLKRMLLSNRYSYPYPLSLIHNFCSTLFIDNTFMSLSANQTNSVQLLAMFNIVIYFIIHKYMYIYI